MKRIPENPTKIKDTELKYLNRAQVLIKKCAKELKLKNPSLLDMRQFAIWLDSKKSQMSKATWRQYKSSIIFYLESLDANDLVIEALDFLRDKSSDGCATNTKKTSSLKLKHISIEDWTKIENEILKSIGKGKQKWAEHLKNWLKAGMLTGLRPIEWKNTKFFLYDDKIPALKVENAKATNGRANGVYRTLLLENLNIAELKVIKDHLQAVRTFTSIDDKSYAFFYQGCAMTLRVINKKIWPKRKKHVTLYSVRHQFSSDAKSSGFTRAEVAAMMGHAVDLTATIHYGKKINGQKKVLIKPVQEEVANVKHIDKFDFKSYVNGQGQQDKGNSNSDTNVK